MHETCHPNDNDFTIFFFVKDLVNIFFLLLALVLERRRVRIARKEAIKAFKAFKKQNKKDNNMSELSGPK